MNFVFKEIKSYECCLYQKWAVDSCKILIGFKDTNKVLITLYIGSMRKWAEKKMTLPLFLLGNFLQHRWEKETNRLWLLQTQKIFASSLRQWKTPSCSWIWRSTTWCEMEAPTMAAAAYISSAIHRQLCDKCPWPSRTCIHFGLMSAGPAPFPTLCGWPVCRHCKLPRGTWLCQWACCFFSLLFTWLLEC